MQASKVARRAPVSMFDVRPMSEGVAESVNGNTLLSVCSNVNWHAGFSTSPEEGGAQS